MPKTLKTHEEGFNYIKSGQFELARKYFSEQLALELKNKKRNVKNYNKIQYGLARVHFAQGHKVVAEKILNGIINRSPKWHCPYLTLGRIYEEKGDFDKTHELYAQGIEQCEATSFGKIHEAKQWLLEKQVVNNNAPSLLIRYQGIKDQNKVCEQGNDFLSCRQSRVRHD